MTAGRRTPEGDALTGLVLSVFELNGEFLAAAHGMAGPVGLTPAGWQVLGAALDGPLTVSQIARRVGLGLARQSVQRVADVLVERGWGEFADNPSDRRARMFAPTERGRRTLDGLTAAQHAWADAVGADVGDDELRRALATINAVIAASRRARGVADADAG